MRKAVLANMFLRIAWLLGILALAACSTVSSPVEEAYHASGASFSFAGGYDRTIFSTNNF